MKQTLRKETGGERVPDVKQLFIRLKYIWWCIEKSRKCSCENQSEASKEHIRVLPRLSSLHDTTCCSATRDYPVLKWTSLADRQPCVCVWLLLPFPQDTLSKSAGWTVCASVSLWVKKSKNNNIKIMWILCMCVYIKHYSVYYEFAAHKQAADECDVYVDDVFVYLGRIYVCSCCMHVCL